MAQRLFAVAVFFLGCSDESRVVPFQPGASPAGAPEAPTSPNEPAAASERVVRQLGGERSVDVEGATLAHPPHRLRALVLEDVDGDGDRDALVLAEGEGEAVLFFARRDAERFTIAELGRENCGGDCEWSTAVAHEGDWRSFAATVQCGENETALAFLLKAGSTPRLIESVSVANGELEVDLSEALTVNVRTAGASIPLRWTEGVGAFALDAAGVASAIDAAEGPAQLERAAAWCGSEARVRLRGATVDCSATHRRLAEVNAALQDGEGGLPAQLQRLQAFGELGQVAARRLCRSDLSVEQLGPAFESPPPRYSALFYRGGRLFDAVRGQYHPDVDEEAPSEPPIAYPSPRGGELLDDAEGEWTSTDPAAPRIPLPPGEWTALAWAPQGIVAFDGSGLQLVPIRDEGPAAPRALSGALPAPLRGSRASLDGTTWAAETPYGVLMHDAEGASLWCLEAPEPILAVALHAPTTLAVATASGIYQLSP